MKAQGLKEIPILEIDLDDNALVMRCAAIAKEGNRGEAWRGGTLQAQDLSPFREPVVRASDGLLVVGLDLIALRMVHNHPTVTVKLVECDDDTVTTLRHADLKSRSDGPRVATIWLCHSLAEKLAAENPLIPPRGGHGGALTKARNFVADVTGLKRNSVRCYLQQHAPTARKKEWSAPKFTLETWGVTHPRIEQFTEEAKKVASNMLTAELAIDAAMRALGRVETIGYKAGEMGEARSKLKAARQAVRGLHPVALCPYCKAWPGIRSDCKACDEHGYAGMEVVSLAPPETTTEGNPVAIHHGRTVKLSDVPV